MHILESRTRRELVGIFVGGLAGAGIALSFPVVGLETPSGILILWIAIFGAMFVGFLFRGEMGWMLRGAMVGAVVAHILWSTPKGNAAALGMVPGALIGLIAGILRDLLSRTQDPVIPQPRKSNETSR